MDADDSSRTPSGIQSVVRVVSRWLADGRDWLLWVKLGCIDRLASARIRDRCSSLSGPISVRSDRGSLGP
jgi:hypothetical protein